MPFAEEGEILVCENHREYKVPLIWTFKHPQAEYWCPFCGSQGGMFGTGEITAETPQLLKRKQLYKEKALPYLTDKGNDVKWEYNIEIESDQGAKPREVKVYSNEYDAHEGHEPIRKSDQGENPARSVATDGQ